MDLVGTSDSRISAHPPPPARPSPGLCVFHRETLCVSHKDRMGPLYIIREIQNSDLGQTIGSENIFWVILVSELRSRALRDGFRINFSSRIQPWASKNPISQGWGNSPRIFWGGPPLAALLAAGWPEKGLLH